RGRKGHYRELFEEVRKKGYLKVRIDGEIKDLVPKMQVDRYKIHDIELVVDRLEVTEDLKARLSQSAQQTLKLGKDLMFLLLDLTPGPSPRERGRNAFDNKKAFQNLQSMQVPSFGGDSGEVLIQYSKHLMCED